LQYTLNNFKSHMRLHWDWKPDSTVRRRVVFKRVDVTRRKPVSINANSEIHVGGVGELREL